MVGQKQEQDGIIKHGSKLINAVSNAKVSYPPLFLLPSPSPLPSRPS